MQWLIRNRKGHATLGTGIFIQCVKTELFDGELRPAMSCSPRGVTETLTPPHSRPLLIVLVASRSELLVLGL